MEERNGAGTTQLLGATVYDSAIKPMLNRDMRQHERKDIRVRGWIRHDGGEVTQCWVADMSAGGAKLTFVDYQPPEKFKLMFSEHATNHRLCVVRWRTLDSVGVQFEGATRYARIDTKDAPATVVL